MGELELKQEAGKKKKISAKVGAWLRQKGESYKRQKAYANSPEGRAAKIKELQDRLTETKLKNSIRSEQTKAFNQINPGGNMSTVPSLFSSSPQLPVKKIKRKKRSKKKDIRGYVIIDGKAYRRG